MSGESGQNGNVTEPLPNPQDLPIDSLTHSKLATPFAALIQWCPLRSQCQPRVARGLSAREPSSRIICTNRGCRPWRLRTDHLEIQRFAKFADLDVEIEDNLDVLVEKPDRHDQQMS